MDPTPRRERRSTLSGMESAAGEAGRWPASGNPGLAATTDLEIGVLGPLEVRRAAVPLVLGGPKERLVVACLVARANQVVAIDTLVDALWGDAPPRSAERTLQAYVARLRRALEPGRGSGPSAVLVRSGPGYRLVIPADRVDAGRFEALARQGAAQLGRSEGIAAGTLREALALWRGDPFAEFADIEACAGEARRLAALRVSVVEDCFDAELADGTSASLVAELEEAVLEHPFRERRWAQLMLALYRAGRQRDALATYQRARTVLMDELGIEPGPRVRELEAAILEQDP